jgi:excisionase family DNA binding protein
MTDVSRASAREPRTATVHDPGATRDQLVSAFVAYIDALVEARFAALEVRPAAAAPLTAAEAAEYARVGVETIRRAIRAGELPTAGAVGRSPRVSREALDAWIAQKSRRPEPRRPRPRRGRGRTSGDAVDAAWHALGYIGLDFRVFRGSVDDRR